MKNIIFLLFCLSGCSAHLVAKQSYTVINKFHEPTYIRSTASYDTKVDLATAEGQSLNWLLYGETWDKALSVCRAIGAGGYIDFIETVAKQEKGRITVESYYKCR